MRVPMKSMGWFEIIMLSGIEKIIGDRFLKTVVESNAGIEELENYFESKNMSQQVYAQARNWGL